MITIGKNKNGENVIVSIYKDRTTTETAQNNGWIRVDTYWNDGTTEETYKR